ncbi:MAG: amino acid ABC transporter permease [Ruminococcus sp.]
MDFSVIQNYIPLFRKALILTLEIGWLGVLLSMVIGVLVGTVVHFRIPVLTQISKVYIEIFRNTPLLIQLFFLYFALPKIGITMSPEVCGVLGLGLLGGSYNAEILRSGIESVEKIQTESALSLGMTKSQVMLHIVLPQAVSSSVPAFVGNIIFLLKETSVFSAVSLMDLMFTAKDIIGLYYKTTEALTLLVIFYLLMLLPVSVLGSILERRLRYGSFGN